MPQKRLFIGLGFSGDFQSDVSTWLKKVKKTADQKNVLIKWTAPENLHVTLVFLGETSIESIPEFEKILLGTAARHPSFSVKVRHVGAFPSVEQARVLWLGVQKSQALLDLQSDLENSLRKSPVEDFDYTPHLTFARLRNPKSCRDLLSPFSHADFGKQKVHEIVLFESLQAGPMTVYKPLFKASLGSVI